MRVRDVFIEIGDEPVEIGEGRVVKVLDSYNTDNGLAVRLLIVEDEAPDPSFSVTWDPSGVERYVP